MPTFPASLRKYLIGNTSPFGDVFPAKANPPPLAVDGRTVALRLFKQYICSLDFYREMAKGQKPQHFRIDPQNFEIEWADEVKDLNTPGCVVLDQPATYEVIGLTSYVEEDSINKYAFGTVVQWQSEYTETFLLEIHASKKPERRSLLAGIEVMLSPTEQMYGLRLRMADYFDQTVCFTLSKRRLNEDNMSSLNRRKATIEIEMRFNLVALVNATSLSVRATANTDVDQSTNVPVDLTLDPNARLGPDLEQLRRWRTGK